MGQFDFGPLSVIAGVRVERTDATYRANSVRDTDGDRVLELSDIVPLSFDQKYTDVLPSVHVNYRPSPDVAIRAAYTNTIGRPNFSDQVPTFSETSGVGTAGNPDLQPYKSMGLDFSAEYYPNRDSVFSAAVFYKKIKNPVFSRILLNTDFAGVELTSLTQPFNADKGYILGFEANAQTRFGFLPAPFDGLGASVNVTHSDSEVEVVGRENEKIPFFRQADWIVNAALFYEKGPLEARLALSYRDDFIVNIGSSTASDIYDKARTVIDARVSYRLFDGFEVFGSLSNLSNAPQAFYQTVKRQIYSREIYSFNADFGVSLSF
jgi:TonB-dependent receptor